MSRESDRGTTPIGPLRPTAAGTPDTPAASDTSDTSETPDTATITLRPIGVVRSRFTDPVGMPIQGATAPAEVATIEIFPAWRAGLADIDGFDYLHVIAWLHRGDREPLTVVPFLDDVERGVFATRAPARPNRLGLSIVRLLGVTDGRLTIAGNDMVDGTPVLDLKPYVPRFDVRMTDRIGWFARRIDAVAETRADDRMAAPPAAGPAFSAPGTAAADDVSRRRPSRSKP